MILSEEKALAQIEKKMQTGRSFLKKADTDPIIQIKARLKELDAEWCRIMNIECPYVQHKDGAEYRLFRRQMYKDSEAVSKLIRQNHAALDLLETTLNGII